MILYLKSRGIQDQCTKSHKLSALCQAFPLILRFNSYNSTQKLLYHFKQLDPIIESFIIIVEHVLYYRHCSICFQNVDTL